MTDDNLRARLTDEQAWRLTIYGESRGESIFGRIAVACVIRNRIKSGKWGKTAKAVCFARAQFSCWWPTQGRENYEHVKAVATALLDGGPPPWSDHERDVHDECVWIVAGIESDLICAGRLDPVRGAKWYYAPAAMRPRGRVPDWAVGQTPVAVVGSHRFYAKVA